MRTPPAYGALGFSKRNATALINGVFFFNISDKMKTPIQELMDEFLKKADSLPDTLDSNVAYLAFQECYDIAKSMLNKEMTVIIEAFHEGMRCQGWDPNRGIAEEYYNETFNTK
jgi:hypothetical protein